MKLLSVLLVCSAHCFAMADKQRKLNELGIFRRRMPHVSQSAMSVMIKELKRVGLPELDERADIRAARDIKSTDRTPYGPISTDLEIPTTNGGQQVLNIAHPLALLWTSFNTYDPFFEFVTSRLAAEPCTSDRPWNLIVYCDEVHPGDQLQGKTNRKFQTVY